MDLAADAAAGTGNNIAYAGGQLGSAAGDAASSGVDAANTGSDAHLYKPGGPQLGGINSGLGNSSLLSQLKNGYDLYKKGTGLAQLLSGSRGSGGSGGFGLGLGGGGGISPGDAYRARLAQQAMIDTLSQYQGGSLGAPGWIGEPFGASSN